MYGPIGQKIQRIAHMPLTVLFEYSCGNIVSDGISEYNVLLPPGNILAFLPIIMANSTHSLAV